MRSSMAFTGTALHDFQAEHAVFIGLVPLLLFNYVGFELQSGAAEEMVSSAARRAGRGCPRWR